MFSRNVKSQIRRESETLKFWSHASKASTVQYNVLHRTEYAMISHLRLFLIWMRALATLPWPSCIHSDGVFLSNVEMK